MWHLHQILRTQHQVGSATMKRVRVPFEINTSSLRLVHSVGAQQVPRIELFIEVKSEVKCTLQVFWGVKTHALGHTATDRSVRSPQGKQILQWKDKVIPTRIALNALRPVRLLPEQFYATNSRTKNMPHHLLEDDVNKDNEDQREANRMELRLARLGLDRGSFRSFSVMKRSEDGGADEFVATLPNEVYVESRAGEEIQSSVVATDCEEDNPSDPVARYACVVVISSANTFGNAATGPSFPSFGMKKSKRRRSNDFDDREEEIICQCLAIDFLPTPTKQKRTPVIVKKLNFTATSVFNSQEIYCTGGECVICLERPLAAVLLPCRHLCVCCECIKEIDQCPICRARFVSYACYEDSQSLSPAPFHVV